VIIGEDMDSYRHKEAVYCWSGFGSNLTHIQVVNPLNAELNAICCLLALLGAHYFLHVSRIRVKGWASRKA